MIQVDFKKNEQIEAKGMRGGCVWGVGDREDGKKETL
jgi:hypothetical protein